MSQQAIWGATIRKAVVLQWGVILALAGGAWLVAGQIAAWSLWCGGAAVALPNTALALWLLTRMQYTGMTGAAAIMRGEVLKLGLTTAMLVVMAKQLRPELSWPALLVGLVGALKAQWLSLWMTRRF